MFVNKLQLIVQQGTTTLLIILFTECSTTLLTPVLNNLHQHDDFYACKKPPKSVTLQRKYFILDPTVIFDDDYSNRTYFLPEKNATHHSGYKDVLVFGATAKKAGYFYWSWYWYWQRRVSCRVTGGSCILSFLIKAHLHFLQRFLVRFSSLERCERVTSNECLDV